MGFDRRTGLIYEGREAATHPVWPTPMLTQATLIESPANLNDIPGDFNTSPFTWLLLKQHLTQPAVFGADASSKNSVTLDGRTCKWRPIRPFTQTFLRS